MIVRLNDRALLKVSGIDAEAFLQSQFSNDVTNIKDGHIQINAYCQHQGKIIAVIWVFKRDCSFYLSFPDDLKEIFISKLNMFKLMSQVDIHDYSAKINQFGLIGETRNNSLKISENLSLQTTRKVLSTDGKKDDWEFACINDKLPEIYLNLSEKFVPQALNLDINNFGVSFTKGCYPGQEVVARMHYLGKSKRRLFIFNSNFKIKIGDSLNVNDSKSLKSSGQIIRVAKSEFGYLALASFEIEQIANNVFLNNDIDKLLNVVYE